MSESASVDVTTNLNTSISMNTIVKKKARAWARARTRKLNRLYHNSRVHPHSDVVPKQSDVAAMVQCSTSTVLYSRKPGRLTCSVG